MNEDSSKEGGMPAGLRVIQVGYEYKDASGGSTQSVSNFHDVFESRVISFTQNVDPSPKRERRWLWEIPYKKAVWNKYAFSPEAYQPEILATMKSADLIVCHGFYRFHHDWAVSVARRHRIPFWIIPHGSLDPYVFTYRAWQKKVWLELIGKRCFRLASAMVFATEQERKKAERFTKGAKEYVINWPVEPVDTTHRLQAREVVRQRHGIPPAARMLLYVGRIHPMKRPLETIEAASFSAGENLHLVIMGPDSDVLSADTCRKYCGDRRIRNVSIVPPVYGKPRFDYYLAADGLVSLSWRENYGYSVAEALSTGLPVVLSPGNDLGLELESVDCGWILKDNGGGAGRAAIREFACAPAARLERMGRNGQVWARSRLSFETFKERLMELAARTVG